MLQGKLNLLGARFNPLSCSFAGIFSRTARFRFRADYDAISQSVVENSLLFLNMRSPASLFSSTKFSVAAGFGVKQYAPTAPGRD
jgi:hypothetical protein